MIKKYVLIGDIDSINLEIISKSHKKIINITKYILFGNFNEVKQYLKKIKSRIKIHKVYDPINFLNYKKNCLNIYDIENISRYKYLNLINQINIANHLANINGIDLITMPINKSLFKKKMNFTGMTEYLGLINKKETFMVLKGERFSVLPITTHINPKNIYKEIEYYNLKKKLNKILLLINKEKYNLDIKYIKFLCYNPHCGEENQLGNEENVISKVISKFDNISGPYAADSAFLKLKDNTLVISTYHDQVLIPFKLINKKAYNLTIGLNFKRLSPAHGTARDIKFRNQANTSSYIECMKN